MCFSAEASFGVGAVLLPAGLYCVRSAIKKDRGFLALSCLPLLFSLQQLCEGLVWVGLENGAAPLAREAALGFLFFALFFWPFWVPFSVAFIEPRSGVRQLLSVLALLALAFGWALYAPVVFDPDRRLSLHVVHHSIQYEVRALPAFALIPGALWHLVYLANICCPLFVTSNRPFRGFAVTLAVSGVVSHFAFRHAFESVWCFFAAVLSLQLCYAFRELRPPAGRGDAQPPGERGSGTAAGAAGR
jgi:hypothetical protein